MPEAVLLPNEDLMSLLKRLNLTASKSEARRLVEQNGVRVQENDAWRKITSLDEIAVWPAVLRIGKKGRFIRLASGR